MAVSILGEAAVRLRPDTGGFESDAETGILGPLTGVAKRAAGLFAAAFAAEKIGSFFTDSVVQATDLSESASKVGVVFGDASGAVEAFAANSARSIGVSEAAALGATGTFGNLLRSTGLTEQASADMSTSMVQLAGDLASFNNASPEETLDALRAGLLGEAEPLKRFGVNLNQAAIEAKAVALGLIDQGDAMTDAQKATAAHALIMEQTSLAQGDFARTSGGLANQQRILSAEFDDVKATVGTALLPILQDLASFVLDNVLPAVQDLAADFEENFGPAVDAVVAIVRDQVIPAFQATIGWLEDNSTWLTIVAGVIAALFIPHLVALAVQSVITGTVTAATWVATQASAIAAAVVHSAQVAWMIIRWVAMAAAAVLNAGLTVGAWIGMGIAAVAQAAIVAAAWLGAQISSVASLVVMAAGFVAQGAVMVASVAVTVASVVAGWVLMATESLIQAARIALAWFIAMGPIGWVIALVIGVVALIIANWETVKNFTIGVFTAIWDFIVGAWNGIVDGISTAIGWVIDLVTGLPGKILSALGNLGSLLLDAGGDLMQGLVDGIAAAASFVGDVAKNVVNAVIGFINDKIIDGINDLLDFTIMGIHVNPPDIPHIPKLHEGGVFDSGSPTGEGLAVLRDDELVVTPEQRRVADSLLRSLLNGTAPAPAAAASAGAGLTVHNQITQLPGEDGATLAARVTQNTVWRLNSGITRRVGTAGGIA